MSDLANFIERPKQPAVKDFRPIGTIKAFNEGILIRLAGLNVAQFNAYHRAPGGKSLHGQLRAVSQTGFDPSMPQPNTSKSPEASNIGPRNLTS
jgi:hypothetical protein